MQGERRSSRVPVVAGSEGRTGLNSRDREGFYTVVFSTVNKNTSDVGIC